MINTSSNNKIYVLDTNILIELNIWLPLEFFPNFWNLLEKSIENDKCIILDVVAEEIKAPTELKKWVQKQKNKIIKITNPDIKKAIDINYKYKMIDDSGKSDTDTKIIAYIENQNNKNEYVLFTREGNRKREMDLYKIPDVCKVFNINCIRYPKNGFYKHINYTE